MNQLPVLLYDTPNGQPGLQTTTHRYPIQKNVYISGSGHHHSMIMTGWY